MEDPTVIQQILDYLEQRTQSSQPVPHLARAPPRDSGLDWTFSHPHGTDASRPVYRAS